MIFWFSLVAKVQMGTKAEREGTLLEWTNVLPQIL